MRIGCHVVWRWPTEVACAGLRNSQRDFVDVAGHHVVPAGDEELRLSRSVSAQVQHEPVCVVPLYESLKERKLRAITVVRARSLQHIGGKVLLTLTFDQRLLKL